MAIRDYHTLNEYDRTQKKLNWVCESEGRCRGGMWSCALGRACHGGYRGHSRTRRTRRVGTNSGCTALSYLLPHHPSVRVPVVDGPRWPSFTHSTSPTPPHSLHICYAASLSPLNSFHCTHFASLTLFITHSSCLPPLLLLPIIFHFTHTSIFLVLSSLHPTMPLD